MGERQPAQLPILPANIFTTLIQAPGGRTYEAQPEAGVRTRAAIKVSARAQRFAN